MKRLVLIIGVLLSVVAINAQIPYFATTVGHNRLYGYTSLKVRPGINAQETYTTFQYGIGEIFATGLDLYTDINSSYMGYLIRIGIPLNQWFNVGVQFTPTFSLNKNMRFEYMTSALYMNGNILNNGKLFWCSNTWYGIKRYNENTISQYAYLGSSIVLPKNQSITPMLGALYSWKFDEDMDMAIGAFWSISKFNIYLWVNDILKSNPRFVIGVDFVL